MKKKSRKPKKTIPKKSSRKKKLLSAKTQKEFLAFVPLSYLPPSYMTDPTQKKVEVVKQRFVEAWIIRGWKLTATIAWRKFGVTRLADIIWHMRRRGFVINTTMLKGVDRFGTKVVYGEYKINKSRSKKAVNTYMKLHKAAA